MDTYYYDDAMLQLLTGMLVTISIVGLVISIVAIIALWRIFEKAGIAGWKSLIPLYNVYCFYKICWGTGWIFLILFVPIANFIVGIITLNRLSKSFGKGIGFTIGLILLSPIFMLILAFGSAEYNALPSV